MATFDVCLQQAEALRRRRRAWSVALLSPLVLVPVWLFAASLLVPNALATATGCVTVAALVVCAYTDVRWRRIPNWVTYTAVLWALLINTFASVTGAPATDLSIGTIGPAYLGAVGIGQCLLGCSICFLVKLLIYSVAKGGAGDVKLAAALGALLGVERGLLALCYAYILAGAFALCLVIWHLGPLFVVQSVGRLLGRFFAPWLFAPPTNDVEGILGSSLPLGVLFAIGTPLAILGVPDPIVFF